MQDTMFKIRALMRAQATLTRIELQTKATQVTYLAIALVCALVALGMLNVGAFLALAPVLGPAWSALLLSLLDVALGAFIFRAAGGVTPGADAATAREVRRLAAESLAKDAESLRAQFQALQQDLGRLRATFSSTTLRAVGLLPGIASIVELLTTALKKKKRKKNA